MAAMGTTTVEAESGSDYKTVTVPVDQRKLIYVDDGETLENVLFDVTATDAGVSIIATGTDWTIRNVAVRGQVEIGDECVLCVADTGSGNSHIENVWIGDGARYEEKGGTGLWIAPEHDGHLEIERVNIQEMSDNGFYCSAPGTDGGGTVTLRNCYAANCWVSHYRIAEGIIENCVASVTDSRQYRKGRGVWAWEPGSVEVKGCHFHMNGHHYSFVAGANDSPSHITVADTQWDDGFHGGWSERHGSRIKFEDGNGNDPQNVIPEGCPASIVDVLPGEVGDISIRNQVSTGETVVVERAAHKPDDFVVVIHDESGDAIGHSDPIEGGETCENLTVALDPPLAESQTATAMLHYIDDENDFGESIRVNDEPIQNAASVTICTEDEPSVCGYTNEDNVVDTSGLRTAIDDWRNGDIDSSLLRNVIDYWRSRDPIEK
ncbi:hypothetical protein CV102_13470 [Natronococcus pandeyae]|uniref:DUF7282 domain-containing protein n=2 Tax=Natronococcus pandeyae TaxID=2055836 RepID=A0A8J8Q489_9EURY|nr:hypothetical protein CV102_13470 [Natronococcus pandeyae]